MRSAGFLVLGVVIGIVVTRPSAAQLEFSPGLNHVAFRVTDYDAALAFYTGTLGFREVGPVRDAQGNVLFTYVQVNRDTFIELFPPGGGGSAGFTHIGLGVDDLDATVLHLQELGVEVEDPRIGRTRAYLTNATGPDGITIELVELRPDSIQRQAVESWPGTR